MDIEEKEKLKKEFQAQINAVKEDLDKVTAQKKPITYDRSHGRMGGIDAMKQKTFQKRWRESLENKLYDLEQNLANIDTPAFGICAICGAPIGDERRKALPETNTCIKCAAK